jgi:hypothetical protein
MTLSAVFQLDDGNLVFVKRLASLDETFGAYREGVMHAIFDNGSILRFLTLAQKYVMIADIKARHDVVAEAPDRFEPEQPAVKIFGIL